MLRCDPYYYYYFFLYDSPLSLSLCVNTKGTLIIAAVNKIFSDRRGLILLITPYLVKY
jgi:hypothetical protein